MLSPLGSGAMRGAREERDFDGEAKELCVWAIGEKPKPGSGWEGVAELGLGRETGLFFLPHFWHF